MKLAIQDGNAVARLAEGVHFPAGADVVHLARPLLLARHRHRCLPVQNASGTYEDIDLVVYSI